MIQVENVGMIDLILRLFKSKRKMIQVENVGNNNELMSKDFYDSNWSKEQNLTIFKDLLKTMVSENKSATFYKFSDGEHYWLHNKQTGSVAPGKRDSNTPTRNLKPFWDGVQKNDYLMCQLLHTHIAWFSENFNKVPDCPVDYIYALVANKWFTKTFDGNIGLIGAGPKLDLIKQLCEYNEYKEYLGFSGFTDYIKMPQRYLCDDLESGEQIMAEQLKTSKSNIFLVGIGHAQQVLLHKMKQYKDAIYIVVGSGIDAYAGVQDNLRPYMLDWVNYQLKDFDYSTIDIWKERFINTVILDHKNYLILDHKLIQKFQLDHLSNHITRKDHIELFNAPDGEHYKLLGYLASLFNNETIIELGTHHGTGTLALSYELSNKIISYDVKSLFSLQTPPRNIECRIGNIFDLGHEAQLLNAKFIFLDTAHTGDFEWQVYEYLKINLYKGIIVYDDIHWSDDMESFWSKVPSKIKYDITDVGHSSRDHQSGRICGTGLIDFNNNIRIINEKK